MRSNTCTLLLITLACALQSCKPEKLEVIGVQNFEMHAINPLTQELVIRYRPVVFNPNPLPVWVDQAAAEIYLDDWHLGTATSRNRIELAAEGPSDFRIRQALRIRGLLPKLRDLLPRDSVEVIIDGRYTFELGGKRLTIPHKHRTYIYPEKEIRKLLDLF